MGRYLRDGAVYHLGPRTHFASVCNQTNLDFISAALSPRAIIQRPTEEYAERHRSCGPISAIYASLAP